jgi:phage host-nuclease inhibitor protein Gam
MSDPAMIADRIIDRTVARENEQIADEIVSRLDALADLQAQQAVLELDKRQALDSVLTPAIRQQIADIELEYAPSLQMLSQSIADKEAEVKRWVKTFGESVKGQRLHAVYMQGRVSWNTRALDGYALAHPELLSFRDVGEPSVSIRKVATVKE